MHVGGVCACVEQLFLHLFLLERVEFQFCFLCVVVQAWMRGKGGAGWGGGGGGGGGGAGGGGGGPGAGGLGGACLRVGECTIDRQGLGLGGQYCKGCSCQLWHGSVVEARAFSRMSICT